MATGEGFAEPVTVSQIIGTVAVPPAYISSALPPDSPAFSDPPNLHWGLVLLFSVLSCGMFIVAWELVQAAWLKKIAPQSKALVLYCIAGVAYLGILSNGFMGGLNHTSARHTGWFQLVYIVLNLWARFSFRASMEEHFNNVEPMGLSLSGVMTFFFGSVYFQYYINDIMKRKTIDRIYQTSR